MNDLIKREHEVIYQTYKRLPIVVSKAEGARIYDDQGNVWLDFLGGIAVNALGHSHPRIIKAVNDQVSKYMHMSNYFYQEPQILLAEKIIELTGFSKIFFSNSGTEAIEGAIKLARRWGSQLNKTEIIAFSGGFHGRTYGALSIMDKPLYKENMGPFLDGMKVIEYNNSEKLKKTVNDKTLAIVIEFIQGEGGVTTADPEFVKTIFELKKKYSFLVIADEIQAGVGRTGKFFSFEHYNVLPDIVTMAKGIGGGLPLGAILALDHLAKVWDKGMHGTTYGGNAVACAAGLVVVEELLNGVMENANRIGEYLHWNLEDIKVKFPKLVLEVRGMRFMKGLLLSFEAARLVDALLEKKVIANAASGNVLRLVPPLIITKEDVDEFISALIDCLKKIDK
jgi:predicted acetylornithine/succinylornithine family transaminase